MKKTKKEINSIISNKGLKMDHRIYKSDFTDEEWNSRVFNYYKECYEKYNKILELEDGQKTLLSLVYTKKFGITLIQYLEQLKPDALIYKNFIDSYKNGENDGED